MAVTDYSKALKEWYVDPRILTMILEDSPGLATLSKKQLGGKYEPLPIILSTTGGHSATFSSSLANKGAPSTDAFNLVASDQYAHATLPRKTMLQANGNMGAFLKASTAYVDSALIAWRRDAAIHLYRDGTGARGRVASVVFGATVNDPTTITLTQRYNAVHFGLGDKLRFHTTKTGTTVNAATFTVTGVSTSAGTVTGTGVVVGDFIANDWIFGDGDKGLVFKGMDAWFPQTDPGALDSFFNVNRSTNPTMLAGVRNNGTGKLRYEALIDAQSEIRTIGGGRPDKAFVHPFDFRALIKEMEAMVTRPKDVEVTARVGRGTDALVGFTGVIVQGDGVPITVVPDRFQEPGVCHILEMSTCGIAHVGPMLADIVGRSSDENMLVEVSSDGYEIRTAGYPTFFSRAPGHSGVIFNFGL